MSDDWDDILILLALLSVPAVRDKAGLPPVGHPLTIAQIADFCDCCPSTIADIERSAKRHLIGAMRRNGIYEELKHRNDNEETN